MPQLHLYVTDEVAAEVKKRADAQGVSTSRFLATVLAREIGEGWPDHYFEKLVGQWAGEPLERSPQGQYEVRESL